jgi:hypothetical protein
LRHDHCFRKGRGCNKDKARAIQPMRDAAHWGLGTAQHFYGKWVFNQLDWERYKWLGRAAERGCGANICVAGLRICSVVCEGRARPHLAHSCPVYSSGSPYCDWDVIWDKVWARVQHSYRAARGDAGPGETCDSLLERDGSQAQGHSSDDCKDGMG